MLAPAERHLVIGIILLLTFGGIVKSCRHRVSVEDSNPEKLPSVEQVDTSAD